MSDYMYYKRVLRYIRFIINGNFQFRDVYINGVMFYLIYIQNYINKKQYMSLDNDLSSE